MTELKNCPFCGREAYAQKGRNRLIQVGCGGISCRGSLAFDEGYATKDIAIAAWNRRQTDDDEWLNPSLRKCENGK